MCEVISNLDPIFFILFFSFNYSGLFGLTLILKNVNFYKKGFLVKMFMMKYVRLTIKKKIVK